MQLYFRPLACSMASRIALYEAGADAVYTRVAEGGTTTDDGGDYLTISPLAQVPALRTDDGVVITEGAAILQYIADAYPESGLAPAQGTIERVKLQQWLNFLASEIHRGTFGLLIGRGIPEAVKAHGRATCGERLSVLENHLSRRDYLLERFSVADAYLVTILNWAEYAGLDLAPYPVLSAYRARLRARPSVRRAIGEELPMRTAA